jgi:hypothetical protein
MFTPTRADTKYARVRANKPRMVCAKYQGRRKHQALGLNAIEHDEQNPMRAEVNANLRSPISHVTNRDHYQEIWSRSRFLK